MKNKTYKKLIVPKVETISNDKILITSQKNLCDAALCDDIFCNSCIYAIENFEVFKQYHEESK